MTAREAFKAVMNQIKEKCPKDYARLRSIVQEIRPWDGDDDGTFGEWIETGQADPNNPETWDYGYGDTPGHILINEDKVTNREDLIALIAHELGHAATRYEDLKRRGMIPFDEWGSELCADWYAYKWGFGRLIRKQSMVRDASHHGPLPGQRFEVDNNGKTYRYHVTRNFTCHLDEIVDATPLSESEREAALFRN